jgi:hypothetical protein
MVSERCGTHLRRLQNAGRSVLLILLCAVMQAQSKGTFTNPLLPSGPDPWVTSKDGYYYTNSTQNNLTL